MRFAVVGILRYTPFCVDECFILVLPLHGNRNGALGHVVWCGRSSCSDRTASLGSLSTSSFSFIHFTF